MKNKMGKKNLYISLGLVANEELSELDFDIRDEHNFDWDKGEYHEITRILDKKLRSDWYVDTTPIKIDKLEALIKKFKKKGATHMQMSHHGDHHGYGFSGFKVELAPQELIDKYNANHKKKKELDKVYNRLKKEMQVVKEKFDKLPH